jgi:hypothetical protein
MSCSENCGPTNTVNKDENSIECFANVTVTDACGATANAEVAISNASAVKVDCENSDWDYREIVTKSKSHTANCNTSYCDDWAVLTGCIEGTLVCIAELLHYDKCRCDVYECYKYVCP